MKILYKNLCQKVILHYKTLNLLAKFIVISITMKQNNFFLFRCTRMLQTLITVDWIFRKKKIFIEFEALKD